MSRMAVSLVVLALVTVAMAAPSSRPFKLQPSLVMSLSPAVISGRSGPVTVSWTGHKFPVATDWIGLWCPGTIDPYAMTPVKYVVISEVANATYVSGSGNATFILTNVRTTCKFYLLTGGAQFPDVLGQSPLLTFDNFNVPTGVHIALPNKVSAGKEHGAVVRVSWVTLDAQKPVVKFGDSPTDMNNVVPAVTSTYTSDDVCGDVAGTRGWFAPGSLHTAVLTGLTPGATYYYTVGDETATEISSWSDVETFNAPKVWAPGQQYRLIAFGDMGNTGADGALQHSWDYQNHGEINSLNTSTSVFAELQGNTPPALVLHIGDISYAVGYEAEWEQFMEQIRPVASRIPWMTSIGNHEMDTPDTFMAGTDSGGECGIPYAARFLMPPPADDGLAERPWYSFIDGPIFFIQMSSEHDFTAGSPQLAWIASELASVDRTATPWVIFTGHRPMYISSDWAQGPTSDQVVAAQLRQFIEPLFVQHGVDLALWGHHHSYQRSCPVTNEVCTTGATTHAVIGMAGYELSAMSATAPSYMLFTDNTHWGYSRITADATSLRLEYVIDSTGDVLDTFTLTKPGSAAAPATASVLPLEYPQRNHQSQQQQQQASL